MLVEQWRREYNTVRPHSACGGFPPAPEAIKPSPWFLRMPVLHGPPQVLGTNIGCGTTLGGRSVMKWAVAMGLRPDNPAGDVLDQALGRHRVVVQHMRALPHSEVAGAIKTVRPSAASVATKLAFEFMVLTACRSGEVRLAGWDEIDLEAGEWTIPGERLKAQRPHRVPLSGARPWRYWARRGRSGGGGGLVFPSSEGRPLSGSTLSTLLRGLRIAAVPHGFPVQLQGLVRRVLQRPRVKSPRPRWPTWSATRWKRPMRVRTCSSAGAS